MVIQFKLDNGQLTGGAVYGRTAHFSAVIRRNNQIFWLSAKGSNVSNFIKLEVTEENWEKFDPTPLINAGNWPEPIDWT